MRTFNISFLAFILGLLFSYTAHAQSHFSNCLDGKGNIFNATVLIPSEINPTVNGAPLSAGSEIAIFSVSPDKEDLCAGVITWQEKNSSIIVWGEDILTPSQDGMFPGEKLTYKVWDRTAQAEYDSHSITVEYSTSSDLYSHDAVYVLDSMIIWGAPDRLDALPDAVQLFDSYPNPFRSETTITYRLPKRMRATLKIYDLLGKEVAILHSLTRPAGTYQVRWDASGFPSGLYIYRLEAGDATLSKTLSLIR